MKVRVKGCFCLLAMPLLMVMFILGGNREFRPKFVLQPSPNFSDGPPPSPSFPKASFASIAANIYILYFMCLVMLSMSIK